ncbi:MAG: Ig-like domain-containing protein [Candidatus Udaeobacter sp.]
MKRKIVANIFLSIGVVLALATLLPIKTLIGQGQPSQASKMLTKTVNIGAKGITLRFPENWSVGQPTLNSWVILNVPADQLKTTKPTVRVVIGYLDRTDHADAVSQLAEYAKESSQPSTFLAIGGWPALQRVQLVKRPQPGNAPVFPDRNMVQITTAVAANNLLVRLEGDLPSDADQQLKNLVLAIGQSLMFQSVGNPAQVQQELNKLQSSPGRRDSPQPHVTPREAATKPSSSTKAANASAPIFPPVQLNNLGNNGELEIAVSNDGANIVVAKQSGFVTSSDGGRTFPFSGNLPVNDGDSSLAFGQSGNFYHAALACFGGSCAAPCPANSNCVEIAASTTNGQTFGALINAVVCPNSGSGACSSDQEHIASDRVNPAPGGDAVYMAFRDLSGSANVTCSPDSGATWAPRLALEGGSDFPRVTVGQDGFLYVVYRNGGNIRIDKFNACTTSGTQMTRAPGGFPFTVSGFTDFAGCEVMNGFGGLDRCNDGNILSSPTVTVDDTTANHVYVAWANNTAANNENTLVADSTDGGVNWRGAVTINTNVTARRFMPWACASGGSAFVTWYDRRAATATNNDLTDYFAASAGLSGGNLVPNNDEFKISTTSDPQCNLWPAAPRSTWDSENCSVQPENAGRCSVSTNIPCDFSGDGTQCPAGETCQTGGGAPKYGDYNGNACVLGRFYTVFASGVGLTSVRNFFQSFVVTSTPTTLTYTGATTGDYHDDVTLSAILTLSGTSAGVPAQTITFTIGAQSCTGITDTTGAASCDLTLNQVPGPYTLTANFAGAGLFQPSNTSTPFTITKEETTLSYTGDTVIANNTTAHLSGVLLEDGTVPIAGRTVVFTLGTGGTAQSCSGVTDGTGVAACDIFPVNQPSGAGVVTANFAGDAFYLPSSASDTTIIFAFLDHGSFVVGDETDTGSVEFWGHSWSRDNVLSGGPAPDSFKGFAGTVSTNPPVCGDTWISRPGNSSRPPDTLPPFMGVVVSSSITKSGSTISGDVPKIVVVTPNPGYEPDPGHPGTGTVVAVYCPNGSSSRTVRPRPTPHPRPNP